jgi:hypothetical protein
MMSDAADATGRRLLARTLTLLSGWYFLVGTVAAHGGSLGAAARETLSVPTWLFLLTGGGAVGASFLLASFVTDRAFVRGIHAWHRRGGVPARQLLAVTARTLGVVGLAVVLVVGATGPPEALANLAILVVWVGWWAGFTATTYLVGNAWPRVNPWRTIAGLLPTRSLAYPPGLGAWPAVVGLLGLVWLEVVSPLADEPRLLTAVVAGYSVVTLVGAALVGPQRWFGAVDPVSRVFRHYGWLAPLTWDEDAGGLRLRLPGSDLTAAGLIEGADEVAFVVALLWVTTYDGLVSTPVWRDTLRALFGSSLPSGLAQGVYLVTLLAGFGLFLGAYRLATRASRRTADSYRSAAYLANRFAPSLLAIAAGYHLAHYLSYFLSLSPALLSVVGQPFSPPVAVPVAQLPPWFGGVDMAFVLLGHLVAIWVAHATAFEVFPGRLQAIRSQYPVVLVMVGYTMLSLWIVSQPSVQPPYL